MTPRGAVRIFSGFVLTIRKYGVDLNEAFSDYFFDNNFFLYHQIWGKLSKWEKSDAIRNLRKKAKRLTEIADNLEKAKGDN
jgi:myosin-crossreactive antigen